jgi:hypothetical protein
MVVAVSSGAGSTTTAAIADGGILRSANPHSLSQCSASGLIASTPLSWSSTITPGAAGVAVAMGRCGSARIQRRNACARCGTSASNASEHLEHAYALTGHGAHGATVEWAGVIGRPVEFTREWAYTSLSRARGRTRVYVVAEVTAGQRQREEYAPPEPRRAAAEALHVLGRAMRRREAEQLAIEAIEPERLPMTPSQALAGLPLAELPEAGAETGEPSPELSAQPPWRAPDRRSRGSRRDQGFEREP